MGSNRNTIYGQCRCCLANGNHRDIMKEYYFNGIREVYYDIFMECFNLFLSTDSKLNMLICSSCVKRLRDANSFRAMVVGTERQLLGTLLDKETLFINVPEGEHVTSELVIKQECEEVKEELGDLEPVHDHNSLDSDPDSDDFVISDIIAKEKLNADLVEGEAELLARFQPDTLEPLPTRSSLYTLCPTYVKQLDMLKGQTILPEMIKLTEKSTRKRKVTNQVYITEKLAQIRNVMTLLEYSNITPFKSKNRTGFPCFYCRNTYDKLDKMREHQKIHKKSEAKKVLSTYGTESLIVYVDITDLKCTICDENMPTLNELKSHLIKKHKKKIRTDISDRMIPFKLSDSVTECQICGFTFETFGSIERHMNVHFRNYVCKDCGTGFVTKYRLKVHSKSMHAIGHYPCESCNKVFTTYQKHKNHVDTVHKLLKRFKCPKCPERFNEYFRRQKHLVIAHGEAPLQYKCNVCEKSFDRRYTLSRHMKRDHLEERDYQCETCSYKCFTNNELRVHMIKHNGERIFECSICKKSYARQKTLKEHMRIHNNDRRFACAVCGQAFVQKCSLKGHIKTHHVEYSMQI